MADFESTGDFRQRWGEHVGWSLVEAEIDGKKSAVLDVNGGDVGLHVSTVVQFCTADFDAAEKTFSCEIKYPEDETSYLVLCKLKHVQATLRLTLAASRQAGMWENEA